MVGCAPMQLRTVPRRACFLAGVAVLSAALLGGGCRTAYYAAWEKLGVEKRDLLK